jgi:quercetin dioxygenase-like cupin family protein
VQITHSSIDTQKGPADWFTGDVYIDAVAAPQATSTLAAASVHFTPGARTAWHTHRHGQTIFVTEGVGMCQREGAPIEEIRPGDRVLFEPGENHWHGAAPNRFMVHIACSSTTRVAARSPGASTSPTSSTGRADAISRVPSTAHGSIPGRLTWCDMRSEPRKAPQREGFPFEPTGGLEPVVVAVLAVRRAIS